MNNAAAELRPLADWAGQQLGGVPGQYIYAQWDMESGGFASDLARNNNNFSGIKDIHGNWRTFTSPDDFAQAYVNFLKNPRYRDAYGQKDFWSWIKGLGTHGNGLGGYYGSESAASYGDKVLGRLGSVPASTETKTPTPAPTASTAGTTAAWTPTNSPGVVLGGIAVVVILALVILLSVGLQGVV